VRSDRIHRLMRQAHLIDGLGVANDLIKLFVARDCFDLVGRAPDILEKRQAELINAIERHWRLSTWV
jgi:hypothetical protein